MDSVGLGNHKINLLSGSGANGETSGAAANSDQAGCCCRDSEAGDSPGAESQQETAAIEIIWQDIAAKTRLDLKRDHGIFTNRLGWNFLDWVAGPIYCQYEK